MLIAEAAESGNSLLLGWLLLLFVWGIMLRVSKLLGFLAFPIFLVLGIVYTIQVQTNS